ncbi:hypothetical protein [Bradyrhizobium sp. Leo121]|uniref:hypothetical protein n=1 Tax=Bradyrhizobium sp. Leo121 TaxID=1571195 RepID=UPI001029E0EE|nr:hypothetical protein [Bradyrhizobium sp. Leo121]RZN21121.1 hypothetical protein CWO90_33515 [Bradyrhizobium sp. Leo121]
MSEAGLLPFYAGKHIRHLSHRELGRVLLAALTDHGPVHEAGNRVRTFEALEGSGIQFGDFCESLISSQINPVGILSVAIQSAPEPACTVSTSATRLTFGEPAGDTASGRVISGDVLRAIIEDFSA